MKEQDNLSNMEINKTIFYSGNIDYRSMYSERLETEYVNRFQHAKFSDNFMKLVMYSPVLNHAYSGLKNGTSPYAIIEELCVYIEEQNKRFEEYHIYNQKPYIYMTAKEFEKFNQTKLKYKIHKFFKNIFKFKK